MPFDDTTIQGFIETTIHKAMECRNNYDLFIHYARLILNTLTPDEQKKHPLIKKIIQAYDNDPDMQRKARLLATAHTDAEASYEYLTQRDRDANLTYDEEFEQAVHTNMSVIIKFYGLIIQQLTETTEITP